MYKILSFDTSTRITGYAVYEDSKLVQYGSIDISSIKDMQSRIKEMVQRIYQLIDSENPNIVIAEESIMNKNAEVHRMLTMILGTIYGECLRKKIDYRFLRPTTWRSLIRLEGEKLPRKRDDLKKWSLQKVNELFGVIDVDDNVSDAILIGCAFLNKEKKDV